MLICIYEEFKNISSIFILYNFSYRDISYSRSINEVFFKLIYIKKNS